MDKVFAQDSGYFPGLRGRPVHSLLFPGFHSNYKKDNIFSENDDIRDEISEDQELNNQDSVESNNNYDNRITLEETNEENYLNKLKNKKLNKSVLNKFTVTSCNSIGMSERNCQNANTITSQSLQYNDLLLKHAILFDSEVRLAEFRKPANRNKKQKLSLCSQNPDPDIKTWLYNEEDERRKVCKSMQDVSFLSYKTKAGMLSSNLKS